MVITWRGPAKPPHLTEQDFALCAVTVDEAILYLKNLDSDKVEQHDEIVKLREHLLPGLKRWSEILWDQTPSIVVISVPPSKEE